MAELSHRNRHMGTGRRYRGGDTLSPPEATTAYGLQRLATGPRHPDPDPAYAEMTKGRIATLMNRPEPRGQAGASTAAEFLHHFAGDTPWAHLDIAGMSDNIPAPYFDKSGTSWGVRLLTELALGSSL
jgi:hypothetical protein